MNVASRLIVPFVIAASAASQGCIAMRPVEYESAASVASQVNAGDRLRVTDARGESFDLTVTAVADDFLEGRTIDRREVRLDAEEIAAIERRARSPARTAALVGGVVLLGFINGLASESEAGVVSYGP